MALAKDPAASTGLPKDYQKPIKGMAQQQSISIRSQKQCIQLCHEDRKNLRIGLNVNQASQISGWI